MRKARSVLIVRDEVRDMKKGRKMRPYSKFCDFLGESLYSDCRKGIRTADNRVQPVADANVESKGTRVDSLIIKNKDANVEHVQTLKKGCRLSTFKCERRGAYSLYVTKSET